MKSLYAVGAVFWFSCLVVFLCIELLVGVFGFVSALIYAEVCTRIFMNCV